jgi:predicted MPP superfamily phosphohydrolase
VLTVLVTLVYGYVVLAATEDLWLRALLAVPFVAIWLVPVLYWSKSREGRNGLDVALQAFAFLSMGWVSFALVFSLLRDFVSFGAGLAGMDAWAAWLGPHGGPLVFALSGLAILVGGIRAATGPKVVEVEIPCPELPPELDGFRIVQISDLHVSSLIRTRYVQRVTRLTNALKPDLVALTGDIIDGPINQLGAYAAPLAELEPKGRVFFITGNHEYYAGAPAWLQRFRQMGMTVLENAHVPVEHNGVELMIAGVNDPAVRMLDPQGGADPTRAAVQAAGGRPVKQPAFKILLAHNPKVASAVSQAGFDLQLSGHTHAGQFFPWTYVVRLVHAPHHAGLSREGKMRVYVSAGTGTWGPPVRLGTVAELTLIKLVKRA